MRTRKKICRYGLIYWRKLVKLLIHANIPVKGAKVRILGLTFKDNVSDIPNSKPPAIINELRQFAIEPKIHAPIADAAETHHEYGLHLAKWEELDGLDALIVAVSHKAYAEMSGEALAKRVKAGGVIGDVKSMVDPASRPSGLVTNWWL